MGRRKLVSLSTSDPGGYHSLSGIPIGTDTTLPGAGRLIRLCSGTTTALGLIGLRSMDGAFTRDERIEGCGTGILTGIFIVDTRIRGYDTIQQGIKAMSEYLDSGSRINFNLPYLIFARCTNQLGIRLMINLAHRAQKNKLKLSFDSFRYSDHDKATYLGGNFFYR